MAAPLTSDLQPDVAPGDRAARRDQEWFGSLYSETVDAAYRYACTLVRSPDLADDVVAEVFLRVWRSRDGFREDCRSLSWVLAITHNCALTMVRRQRNELDVADIDESCEPSSGGSTSGGLETHAISMAITRLTPEQQRVIFLRFFKELPHEQIARELGRNPGAIRAIQFRALKRLRTMLKTED